jgi:hypothetical protein
VEITNTTPLNSGPTGPARTLTKRASKAAGTDVENGAAIVPGPDGPNDITLTQAMEEEDDEEDDEEEEEEEVTLTAHRALHTDTRIDTGGG